MYSETGVPHVYLPDHNVNMVFLQSGTPGDWALERVLGPDRQRDARPARSTSRWDAPAPWRRRKTPAPRWKPRWRSNIRDADRRADHAAVAGGISEPIRAGQFPGCLKRVHARLQRAMAARRPSRRGALLIRGPSARVDPGSAEQHFVLHRVRDTRVLTATSDRAPSTPERSPQRPRRSRRGRPIPPACGSCRRGTARTPSPTDRCGSYRPHRDRRRSAGQRLAEAEIAARPAVMRCADLDRRQARRAVRACRS